MDASRRYANVFHLCHIALACFYRVVDRISWRLPRVLRRGGFRTRKSPWSISNREDAPGLTLRGGAGNSSENHSVERFAARGVRPAGCGGIAERAGVEMVCLAGFMRLLSPYFVAAFPNRILNIHPSLLPSFPGLEAQRQALEYGVKFSGCTVHLVDENLDAGPILAQSIVPVRDDDTPETLAARILVEEHRMYTEAVRADSFRQLPNRRPARDRHRELKRHDKPIHDHNTIITANQS